MSAWRTQLLLAERVGDAETLSTTILAPRVVIQGIELLVQERQLTRRAASMVEEQILRHVNAHCGWQ